MAKQNQKKQAPVKHNKERYNREKTDRSPIKEQEVAQRGNVENLDNDEASSR